MTDGDSEGQAASGNSPWWKRARTWLITGWRPPAWVVAGFVAATAYVVLAKYAWLDHLGERALFGDAFAPWTGLITAGALVASLWAVTMQREELRLQRQEMASQRKETRRSREQLERQVEAQRLLALSQAAAVRVNGLQALALLEAAGALTKKLDGPDSPLRRARGSKEIREFQEDALWNALRHIEPVIDELEQQADLAAHK